MSTNNLLVAYERLAIEADGLEMLPNDCTTDELVVASFKLLMEELADLRRDLAGVRDELSRIRSEGKKKTR